MMGDGLGRGWFSARRMLYKGIKAKNGVGERRRYTWRPCAGVTTSRTGPIPEERFLLAYLLVRNQRRSQ
jgi:hypothetical protein